MAQEVRVDKWMWAVRLFKTRSKAADACKKNKVTVDGIAAKPSRMVKVGEVIGIRKGPVTCSFEILAIAHNRMGLSPLYHLHQQLASLFLEHQQCGCCRGDAHGAGLFRGRLRD